jgi:hypothetical protein
MKTIEQLLDDAATCSQHPEMTRDEFGNEPPLRECVRLGVAEPLMKEIERLNELLRVTFEAGRNEILNMENVITQLRHHLAKAQK